MKLNPTTTFVQINEELVCLAFLANKKISIFGNLVQSNLLVGYDLCEENSIFQANALHQALRWKLNCMLASFYSFIYHLNKHALRGFHVPNASICVFGFCWRSQFWYGIHICCLQFFFFFFEKKMHNAITTRKGIQQGSKPTTINHDQSESDELRKTEIHLSKHDKHYYIWQIGRAHEQPCCSPFSRV